MMIVVADDFTGAAEIAGAALRHGLRVVLTVSAAEKPLADVWVISTDMRSMPRPEALAWVRAFARQFADVDGDAIFFKIDSVLRGYPIEILWEYRESVRRQWVLVVPANPSLGRVIRDGVYYVDGVPLGHSSFALPGADWPGPSRVVDLIPAGMQSRVQVAAVTDRVAHDKPIVVGNASKEEDLKLWAQRLNRDTIAAGGAGFFEALLSLRGVGPTGSPSTDCGGAWVMVCGSFHANSREAVEAARKLGVPVADMPRDWLAGGKTDAATAAWADEAVAHLRASGRVVITAGGDVVEARKDDIREITATVVDTVLQRAPVGDLLVEGGATAAAILRRLGYASCRPLKEWARGVVTMAIDGAPIRLTTKPGSYRWPADLWAEWIQDKR